MSQFLFNCDAKESARSKAKRKRAIDSPAKQHDLDLPPPQIRVVLPPLPGKRDDGKLWFEN